MTFTQTMTFTGRSTMSHHTLRIASLSIALVLGGACSRAASSPSSPSVSSAVSHARRAEPAPEPTQASRVAGCSAPEVYFASGSAELTEDDRTALRALALCLERHEIDTLYVVGRTDPVGTPEENHRLGMRRAEAVAAYLQQQGAAANFVVKSRGESGASDARVLWPVERAAAVLNAH